MTRHYYAREWTEAATVNSTTYWLPGPTIHRFPNQMARDEWVAGERDVRVPLFAKHPDVRRLTRNGSVDPMFRFYEHGCKIKRRAK